MEKEESGHRPALAGKQWLSDLAWRQLWLLVLPALSAFLLFLPSIRGGLVWDDPLYLEHPFYLNLANWPQAWSLPFLLSPNYYRPLAATSFFLTAGSPLVHHLANIVLHTLNTALLTWMLWRLIRDGDNSRRRVPAVLLASMFYAVHPAVVEGVAFVSGRFDLLLTTFLLVALLADLVFQGRRWLRATSVGLAFLLACFSKEMAIGFLLVLPLWHFVTGNRQATDEAEETPDGSATAGSRIASRFPFVARWLGAHPSETLLVYPAVIASFVIYLLVRYAALGYLFAAGSGRSLPTGSALQHLLLVGRSLLGYTLVMVWPFTAIRPIHFTTLPVPLESISGWLALLLSALIVIGLLWWLRTSKGSSFLVAATFLALLPVLNILPLELGGGAYIADRFLQFPLALLALALGLFIARFDSRGLRLALGLWLVAGVAAVQLTLPYWRSDQSLWEWAMRRSPESPVPYTNLALVAINQGNPAQGLSLAQQALALNPDEDNAYNHLGLALFRLGRYEEAQAAFAKALDLDPENALYWSNLAGALRESDQLSEAERILLDEALPRDPDLGIAHFNLGLVYLKADRPDLAAQAFIRAMDLLPPLNAAEVEQFLGMTGDPERWLRLGDLLLANDQPEGALEAFAQAEQQGADPLEVTLGRSVSLITLGELESADALLQAALLTAPQDARIFNNLGLVAQLRNQIEEARTLFGHAAELAPEWEVPRQNLEALQAE